MMDWQSSQIFQTSPDNIKGARSASLLGRLSNNSSGCLTGGVLMGEKSRTWWRYFLLFAARDLILADFESDQIIPIRNSGKPGAKDYPHVTAFCHRMLVHGKEAVDLLHFLEKQAGGFGNLFQCSRLWTCPLCAAKISERRQEALSAVFDRIKKEQENTVVMITLTLSHGIDDPIKKVLDLVKSSYDALLSSGRAAEDFNKKWGILGRVRALEVTWWVKNGWHVHLHVALVLRGKPSEIDLNELERETKARWVDIVERRGGIASFENGVAVSIDCSAAYLSKIGVENLRAARGVSGRWSISRELTKSNNKQSGSLGLSPQALLMAYGLGGVEHRGEFLPGYVAGQQWIEYAAGFFRQKHLQASGIVKEMLKEELSKSDREIVEEQKEVGRVVGQWLISDYRRVLDLGEVPNFIELLARDDKPGIVKKMSELGIEWADRHLAGDALHRLAREGPSLVSDRRAQKAKNKHLEKLKEKE